MDPLAAVLISFVAASLAFAIFVALVAKRLGLFGSQRSLPEGAYRRRDALLSRGESAFFAALSQAVQSRSIIFAQVQLSRIIEPSITATSSDRRKTFSREQSLRNRINRKSVDFVLCDPHSFTVQLIIELDDKSHAREKTKIRDAVVDAALKSAKVPILHIRAAPTYNAASLEQQIRSAINPPSQS